jgi:molecular chaperone IbpA
MTLLETFFLELCTTSSTEYNLIKSGDSELVLELPVLGIPEEDVDVEVSGNKLTVSATAKDNRSYLYSGFAKKSFRKTFNLRDDIVVKSATVKNGILRITLDVQIPEQKRPRKIMLTH